MNKKLLHGSFFIFSHLPPRVTALRMKKVGPNSTRYTKSERVNVNTTDATTGATALLLPAQNTHTLHDPIRDPEHARAGGVEDGVLIRYNAPRQVRRGPGASAKIDRIRAMTAYDDRDPTTCVPRPGRIPYAASAIARSVA